MELGTRSRHDTALSLRGTPCVGLQEVTGLVATGKPEERGPFALLEEATELVPSLK